MTPVVIATAVAPEHPEGTLLTDRLNNFALTVPQRWIAHAPPPDAGMGMTVITNYDPLELERQGVPQEGVFPPGTAKVQIINDPIPPGTFDLWVEEIIRRDQTGGYSNPAELLPVTGPEPITLAGYSGVTFQIGGGVPVVVFLLDVGEGQVIRASVMPADTPALDEALAMLATLQVGPAEAALPD